jgi:carboxymethylenebutenolidase
MLLAIGDFLRFLVAALFFLLLVIIGMLVGTFVADAFFSPTTTSLTSVTYPTEAGDARQAYLKIPLGEGPYPGLIVIPDYWGLNDHLVFTTNVLGDSGFVVITPDIFHGATSQVIHRALMLGLTTPRSRIYADLDAAYTYLRQHTMVIPDRIGVVGFGYGGGIALEYAAQNPQLDVVVDLYGPVTSDLGEFEGAVMGLFGSQDRLVRPDQADKLWNIVDAAGLDSHIEVLQGLDNGFASYPDIVLLGRPQNDAWKQMLIFLHDTLDPIPACRLPDLYYQSIWCGW